MGSIFSNTAQDPFAASQWSDSQQKGIADAFNQYRNDPATLKSLMAQTGVSAQHIANIVGMDPYEVNSIVNPPTIKPNTNPITQGQASSGRDWMGLMQDNGWAGDPSSGAVTPAGGPASGGSGGGGAGGGMGAGGGGGAGAISGKNPYLSQMGDALTQQATQAFNRNVLPSIGSGAMAAGGYGGSRQGVIEANAMNDLGQNITNGLAGMYGQAYNNGLQYDLGIRNNQLGFGNLGLGYAGLDNKINNDNLGWQMQGAQLGLGIQNQLQQNSQSGITAGTNINNTPMNNWSQFSNQANSIGNGFGTTTGSTSAQGNPLMGALGGAQLGSQIGNLWGGSPNAAGGSNSSGWGTGSGYGNQDYGSFF